MRNKRCQAACLIEYATRPVSPALALARHLAHDGGVEHKRIAETIGYSRCAVSLWLKGSYPGGTVKIEAAFWEKFGQRHCPHDHQTKLPVQCRRAALRPRPSGFPDAEALWLACQGCAHKPKEST